MKDVAPVIVVAPHSTFFDALAIFWSGLPFIVSREENKEYFTKFAEHKKIGFLQNSKPVFFVEKGATGGRVGTKNPNRKNLNMKKPT